MARPAKSDSQDGEVQSSEPTKVRVKHFKVKKLSGGYTNNEPATSVNPEQIYDIVDLEKIKATLALEGIETEEIERF